jgi:UDP-N-acetylmuramate: L-alanyl-gamma-D-glutamyl-meso-diaminopimelate ligase
VIINNLEFDHADIFENLATIQKTFTHLIRLIPRGGLLLANGDDENIAPLLHVNFCPVKRFGLGENNAIRAFNLRFGPTASTFEIPSFKFQIDLVGELNVRNALAVVAVAKHCGLKNQQIQDAFSTFRGIKRRMEVKGIAGGVTIVDDFGHHPTAIRETLKALRLKFANQKIWAVFEPRTNTTRRNVFQAELAAAFADADGVVISEIARLDQVPVEQRLDPARLMADIKALGKTAEYLPTVDTIVDYLKLKTSGGDVVCIFSNGGFGGIHGKLLNALQFRR